MNGFSYLSLSLLPSCEGGEGGFIAVIPDPARYALERELTADHARRVQERAEAAVEEEKARLAQHWAPLEAANEVPRSLTRSECVRFSSFVLISRYLFFLTSPPSPFAASNFNQIFRCVF